jgi:hypothetical protein
MMLHKTMIAAGLAIAATCGVASAQALPGGRVYTFHSKAQGSCPALDWHVVAESNGDLSGMIAWNNMQQMARATGTVNMANRTFSMNAVEVGGQGRTATVTGTVRQDGWLVANINGPNVACTGVTVPWGVTPQGVTGGNG